MSRTFNPLSLFDNDQESRFLNLFNRFRNQYQAPDASLPEDDPDVLKYRELSESPTGSESLINDYVSGRPTREQFAPDLKTKIIAFLAGTLSGEGGTGAEKIINRPYERAEEDWRNEGQNIASRARLIDAERQRELAGLKTVIGNKERAFRTKSANEFKAQQEARRIADEIATSEQRDTRFEADEEQRDWKRTLSEDMFNQRKSMDEFRRERDARDYEDRLERRRLEAIEKKDRENAIGKVNRRLSDYASQQGIDSKGMTAMEVAELLAFKRLAKHKAFGDMIIEDGNDISWNDKAPGFKDRERIARMVIHQQVQKLLRGEFN